MHLYRDILEFRDNVNAKATGNGLVINLKCLAAEIYFFSVLVCSSLRARALSGNILL
jgi:hypothetical protein